MTLTTERQQFAEQNEMSMDFVNWFFDEKKDGCGNAWLIMAAAMWEGWKGRANREAQPVGFRYRNKDTVSWLYNDWRWPDSVEAKQCQIEWLYTAPPAPANAQSVAWEMRYGNSGHNCWHDWERITAEQHAEMSAEHATSNDYEFRVLYDAPPAPAVNASPDFDSWFVEKYKQPERLVKNEDGAYKFSGVQMAFSAWSDGRAAMLAQPVSSGYTLPDGWKLVPIDATRAMIDAAQRVEEDGYDAMHKAMLAAAPESVNGA